MAVCFCTLFYAVGHLTTLTGNSRNIFVLPIFYLNFKTGSILGRSYSGDHIAEDHVYGHNNMEH